MSLKIYLSLLLPSQVLSDFVFNSISLVDEGEEAEPEPPASFEWTPPSE